MQNKLIIAGTRTFDDYDLLELEVKRFIVEENITDPIIVSGCALGADQMGEDFAEKYGFKVDPFPVSPLEWKTYGKYAGHLRNEKMAQNATHCIVFWQDNSPGSKNMIENAEKYNLKLKVIKV